MNYSSFKEYVHNNLADYLPKELEGSGILLQTAQKINRECDSIILNPNGTQFSNQILPTIYVNDMYDKYLKGESVDTILREAAEVLANAIGKVPDEVRARASDFERIKSEVIVTLVNTAENKDMLENVPHREFNDLSIVYRWVVSSNADGLSSAIIRNNHMEILGISEEELYGYAMENTRNNYPVNIRSMEMIMSEMLFGGEMEGIELTEEEREVFRDAVNSSDMFVMTNAMKLHGANAMLMEDKLYEFSQTYGGSFYIIPSSINEIIIVSPKHTDAETLAQMVFEVNRDEVDVSERLSNEVYFYDQDKREVVLATDVPNKSLKDMDGVQFEISKDEPEIQR